MSRNKDGFKKEELDGLSDSTKLFAVALGRKFMPQPASGFFHIETVQIARAFANKTHDPEAMKMATAMLVAIVTEAAQTHDVTKLRWLADQLEKRSWVHDPLRFEMLISKFPEGMEKPPPPLKTAQEWQDFIRKDYSPGAVPTLKTIREVAAELGVKILKMKRGAPKGVRRKTTRRAKR